MRRIPATHPDDLDVAARALSGETSARATFAQRMSCVPRMLAAMNRRQRGALSREDVEDLVQDTLVTIWRRLDTYEGMASLETWAYRFCRFQLANRMRAVARRPTHVDIAHETAAAEDARHLFEFEQVHVALEQIDPLTAEIIRLKHFAGLTFEELGPLIAVPANTAKTRYYRGLARLRQALAARLPDGEARSVPARPDERLAAPHAAKEAKEAKEKEGA